MINCIIIDDQKESINVLESHISSKPELTLLKSFENPVEAYNFLKTEKVDLVFIDIKMPKMTGLDVIESIRLLKGNDVPKFIITTGYNEYALNSYEQGAIDYLMKPITFKRFSVSLDRYIANTIPKKDVENDFIFIVHNERKLKLNYSEITYIEGDGNYINIYSLTGRYVVYNTLSNIIKTLPDEMFIRNHKSFIVAIKNIDYIKGEEIYLKGLKELMKIPIGASYKEALSKRLKL